MAVVPSGAMVPISAKEAAASKPRHQSKGERRMFSASDDSAMMKQIQATHSPDGREVDVKPILLIVEDVFRRTARGIDGFLNGKQGQVEMDDKSSLMTGFDGMLEALAYIIHKISCEIACKCSGSGDPHGTTMAILNAVSSYPWDGKVVIALAAFAVNYGEFWLVAQLFNTHPLAKSVALLKQITEIIESSDSLRPQFEALNHLIEAMLEVAKCIVAFTDLPSQYISDDEPPMSIAMAHIPAAAYWTIRSVVACASQIGSVIGTRQEYTASTTETWELSSLAHKVNSIRDHLMKQLALCHQHIDEKRHMEYYLTLVRLFETLHLDNMKILKALIYKGDDMLPLLDGVKGERVSLELLRKKYVLLLISDLNVSQEEIACLSLIYSESKERHDTPYEVVWLPILDDSTPLHEETQEKFRHLQSLMPWYTVYHPSVIEPAVVKFVKEVWHFAEKAIIVVLDPQGRVVCPNALHMVWIWQNTAFPFTSEREEALWREETWRLELIVDHIDTTLLDWMRGGGYICLYGGENITWIRNFTKQAKAVAKAAGFTFKMVYAGKANAKDRVRKITETISTEALSEFWAEPTFVWFFWARLESMLYSKLSSGKNVETDQVLHEVMTLLSYDGSDQGWAIFCRGPAEMTRANGELALTSMTEFDEWKEDAKERGFVPALHDYLLRLHTPQHCNRLILPGVSGGIPERVVCAECGRLMEKYYMYRCCVD